MPNTFGTKKTRVQLVDPRAIRRARERFRRETIPELEFANSLYVPRGRRAARGWILLTASDYASVRNADLSGSSLQPGYSTSFQLEIDDLNNPPLTFSKLAIVQACCVTTGLTGDPNAIYLVELTDQRGVLENRWFSFPTVSYYNVLAPAYPASYYAASLIGGVTPWTWDEMIEDLWNQMGAFLGAYPLKPPTPAGTPTNWNLNGVNAWAALNAILAHLGMAVSCDLANAALSTPYGLVGRGGADATFATLLTTWAANLEDDLAWIDAGSGRVPGVVIVYFRRVNQFYGTEETVRSDALQWATNATYSVPVNAPTAFLGASGTASLWDDFPVRYDVNGNQLAADVTTAAAIASERVTQFFQDIYDGTLGYMDQTYTGALPFYAGSQVDGVCWRQDYQANARTGWVTQIKRGELWKGVYGA